MIDRSRWNVQLVQRVLATDPISYWVGDEKRGSIAYDLVSGRVAGAQNGAITGVTLGHPGIGDGRTSGFFDGATDYIDINTAAFVSAFSGSEISVSIWLKMLNAGVWIDGVQRTFFRITYTLNNLIWMWKSGINNQISARYAASGVNNTFNINPISDLNWMNFTLTASASLDEARFYYNGVQQGATQGGLGVWGGAVQGQVIGALDVVPQNVTNGYIDHVSVWDRALPPAEAAPLYQESF